MEKEFSFESDFFNKNGYCTLQTVTIQLMPESKTTGDFKIISIFDEDYKVNRKLSDFPNKEQQKILDEATLLADSFNYCAWLDKVESGRDL